MGLGLMLRRVGRPGVPPEVCASKLVLTKPAAAV